jgi:hypothetical protein
LLFIMGGIIAILPSHARAEPWSIEPRLGASTDFETNPGLRQFDPVSEAHIAALFDVPLRYDTDGIELALISGGRVSNSRGYSSLSSNYAHLDANALFSNELGSTSLSGGLLRDSSLYHAGELVNGIGVRRDTASTTGDWNRALTERSQIQLDLSWTRVTYDQPSGAATPLVNYRYASTGPTYSFDLSERNTVKLSGNYGSYQALDGITDSKSANLQLGFARQLDELWSLSVIAGYSHSINSQKHFLGPLFLGSLSFEQNGAVYAATLTRKGEHFNLSGGVSRSLQPTGLAFLSRLDSINLNATYAFTERWDFALQGTWQRTRNPLSSASQTISGASESEVLYLNAQFTANWHWTPQWLIAAHVTRIAQQYGLPPVSAASTGVSVDVVRQFLRIDLQ